MARRGSPVVLKGEEVYNVGFMTLFLEQYQAEHGTVPSVIRIPKMTMFLNIPIEFVGED